MEHYEVLDDHDLRTIVGGKGCFLSKIPVLYDIGKGFWKGFKSEAKRDGLY